MTKEELIKDFLIAPSTKKVLLDIIKKYDIGVEVEELSEYISRILEGSLPYEEFSVELEEELDIDYDVAFEIVDLINDSLLSKFDTKESAIEEKELKVTEQGKSNAGLFIQSIIKLIGITFSDPSLQGRFNTVIESYIRDVRKEQDIRGVLERNSKVGGLGLSADQIEKIVALVKEEKKRILEQGITLDEYFGVVRTDAVGTVDDLEIDVATTTLEPIEEKVVKDDYKASTGDLTISDMKVEKDTTDVKSFREAFEDTEKKLEAVYEIPTHDAMAPHTHEENADMVIPGDGPGAVINSDVQTEKDIVEEIVPPVTSPPAPPTNSPVEPKRDIIEPQQPQPIQDAPNARPKVEDIKYTPRVFSPIDELRNLDVPNFKRLGDTPEKAAQKLYEKIKLFEEESYNDKVAAMEALQESPLYKRYSDIIQRSFSEGKSAASVLKDEDGITLEEFKALLELNNELSK